MKLRFVETFLGYPKLEIMPDSGDFNGIDGRIEVSFFEMDIDSGKGVYDPRVSVNVSFSGRMHPDMADAWGDCFHAAHLICQRGLPNYKIDRDSKEAVVNAFMRVDELRG